MKLLAMADCLPQWDVVGDLLFSEWRAACDGKVKNGRQFRFAKLPPRGSMPDELTWCPAVAIQISPS